MSSLSVHQVKEEEEEDMVKGNRRRKMNVKKNARTNDNHHQVFPPLHFYPQLMMEVDAISTITTATSTVNLSDNVTAVCVCLSGLQSLVSAKLTC